MPARDNVKVSVAAIILAVFVLSFGDALIKRFSVEVSMWQIFIMRSALALPVVWAMMKIVRVAASLAADERAAPVSLVPRNPGWTLLRSYLFACMIIAFQASLPHLPLSTAAAGLYTLPLFITLFTALFSGEAVRAHGWLAIGIGFAGMLLILRPQAEDFNFYALLPVLSAVLYAVVMMLTRARCAGEHPLALAFHAFVAYAVIGCAMVLFLAWQPLPADANPFLLTGWRMPDADDWGMMAVLAAILLIGMVGGAIAYQRAPPPVIATFDFCYLPFAALWSIVLFADVPNAATVAGMLLIAIGGTLALRQ